MDEKKLQDAVRQIEMSEEMKDRVIKNALAKRERRPARVVRPLRAALIAAVCLLLFAGLAMSLSVHANASVSAQERKGVIKVFVGDINGAPWGYVESRWKYLRRLAASNPDETVEAVIGLDGYYPLEKVADWLEQYDVTASRLHMWPEGETGRLALYVENGVQDGISAYIEETEEFFREINLDESDVMWKDFQRFLNGEFGVYAMTVTASAETLDAMASDLTCFAYVDIMYNEDVERYAARRGKDVYYIELPAKPDGAL